MVWMMIPIKLSSYYLVLYLAWRYILMITWFKAWIFLNCDAYMFVNTYVLECANCHVFATILSVKLFLLFVIFLHGVSWIKMALWHKLMLMTIYICNSDVSPWQCKERWFNDELINFRDLNLNFFRKSSTICTILLRTLFTPWGVIFSSFHVLKNFWNIIFVPEISFTVAFYLFYSHLAEISQDYTITWHVYFKYQKNMYHKIIPTPWPFID